MFKTANELSALYKANREGMTIEKIASSFKISEDQAVALVNAGRIVHEAEESVTHILAPVMPSNSGAELARRCQKPETGSIYADYFLRDISRSWEHEQFLTFPVTRGRIDRAVAAILEWSTKHL